MSRNLFVYSSLTLGAIATAVWLLHSAITAIVPEPTAAGIMTAIVTAFLIGALSALLVLRFGAWLKAAIGVGERAKEIPPRRIFLPAAATSTSPASTPSNHSMETEYHPVVMVQNGVARLLNQPTDSRRADVIEWAELDPQRGRQVYHTIDLATLRRFARLHTPSRSEWSGKATTYTEALACFKHHAWVKPTGAGKGVAWVHPFDKTSRRLACLGDPTALLPPS